MNEEIIAIYCLCDDFIHSKCFQDWPNAKLSTAEVMTIAIVAMRFFYGNMERARIFLFEHGYMPYILSKSRLNRRFHAISSEWWNELLNFAVTWKKEILIEQLIIDTFPIAACRNIRINRCRLFEGEQFRGYNASKREYFFGLKVMVVTTGQGYPLQVTLAPGSTHDATILRYTPLSLQKPVPLFADAAYMGQPLQKIVSDQGPRLVTEQRSNALEPIDLEDWIQLKWFRKRIETTFSQITQWMSRTIHAVSPQGFELKILGFIAAFAVNFILNL